MAYIGFDYRRGNGNPRFSPTFPRAGLAALFACDVLDNDPGVTMSITIEHKNHEDLVYTTLAVLPTMALGVNSVSVTGVKEEVRFAFAVNGAAPSDAVYANVLAPIWRPY